MKGTSHQYHHGDREATFTVFNNGLESMTLWYGLTQRSEVIEISTKKMQTI